MAINKKLIHFKTRAAFEIQLAEHNILDTSIVFIQDANLIWTHGTYYCLPSDDVVISDGIEPDNDQDLWIDTSDNTTAVSVEEAPTDGNMYVRKDGTWVVTLNEVYVGGEEPTNGEVIWINPNTDEMKYFNGIQWVTVSGKTLAEETLIISLVSNQTNPDSNLNGAIVNVRYLDVDHKQAWGGEALSFKIPSGTEYTIEYSDITDLEGNKIYATPATETYTAVGNETRTLSRYYNQTRITITRSSNLGSSDSLGSSTASISCSSWSNPKEIAFSDLQPEITIGVLTGDTITILFSDITDYATPTIDAFTAEGVTMSKPAEYKATAVTIERTSNISIGNSTAVLSYGNETLSFTSSITSFTRKIPWGTSYSVTYNDIKTGTALQYNTPAKVSKTANEVSQTVTGNYAGCNLTVTRTNNQSASMEDTSATITYSSYSQIVNFTSSTNSVTITIPYNVSYTIAFNGTITNYRTPANITGTSSSTAITETGSYDSEKLTVNVSGVYSGFTVTVNGQSQTATSGTYYIPYDTAYTISASSVKGYNKEISESSITASQQTRTVTVAYTKIANGIYICDNTGALTAVGSWNTANNSSAVGVAVIDGNCSFVIGKTQSNGGIAWSNTLYGTTVSGIKTTTDSSTAKTDYAGEANSSIVRGLTSGETNAFNWAYSNTITVNGTTLYGYIGALGEWQTAYNNKPSIDSALSKIGGTAIPTGYHWASTQYSSSTAWLLSWDGGNVNRGDKNGGAYVRAFYPLP